MPMAFVQAAVPMTSFEIWSLVVTGGQLALGAVGLPIIWYQLRLHRKERADDNQQVRRELEADHDRRKKQVTIDYLVRTRPAWRLARGEIQKAVGSGKLNEEKLRTINASPDLDKQVHGFLGDLELFAVGVNSDVLDGGIVYSTCGSGTPNESERPTTASWRN